MVYVVIYRQIVIFRTIYEIGFLLFSALTFIKLTAYTQLDQLFEVDKFFYIKIYDTSSIITILASIYYSNILMARQLF